ncbi:MAG: alpha-L-rhamnosidase [Candidatus Coatesbacteria bacterium]
MARRILIEGNPFSARDVGKEWLSRGLWPAKWIAPPPLPPEPDGTTPSFVAAFRLRFDAAKASTARMHVSADERYELFVDGERVGRGPERGDAEHWFFETWDIPFSAGAHTIVARVWAMGDKAPFAQMTIRPGFLVAAEGEWQDQLSTGTAAWETCLVGGYTFVTPDDAWGTGWNIDLDGAKYPWGFERGDGQGWSPAVAMHQGGFANVRNETPRNHMLLPATLPPMMEVETTVGSIRLVSAPPPGETRGIPIRAADHLAGEAGGWERLIRGEASLTVPAKPRRRVLVDLGNYYCAYPELEVSGGRGASVRVRWEEGLYAAEGNPKGWIRGRHKGNRNEVEGKLFIGIGDTFRPEGGAHRIYSTLWWQAGRFVEILVETGDEALFLDRFVLRETRYPLEMESSFDCDDARLKAVIPVMVRGLQMCSHETYMDCPFYEQLMYVGDTRLEAKTTLMLTVDDRLPRKAIRMFDASRILNGLTQSRYPSRIRQIIPPFSIWWTLMVHDSALWRGDEGFVRSCMPGVRGVLDYYRSRINADGLVAAPAGWNYVDWVPGWDGGMPVDADTGISGAVNWQFVYALSKIAELERWLGEKELSDRNLALAARLTERLLAAFWDDGRGLLADDLKKTSFSEHVQCLAILGAQVEAERLRSLEEGLMKDPNLHRTTIYFTHYLFDTYRVMGRADAIFDRLKLWLDLPGQGFKTTLESPEPTRSDCHAWGAHPLYHYFASILGIRPAALGAMEFSIEPELGPLQWASGKLVTPKGLIEAGFRREGQGLRARIVLPPGLTGEYVHAGKLMPLKAGSQEF